MLFRQLRAGNCHYLFDSLIQISIQESLRKGTFPLVLGLEIRRGKDEHKLDTESTTSYMEVYF